MMALPVQSLPNQSFQVQLVNQSCTIQLAQQTYGLFCNVFIGSELIIGGVICLNLVRIVRSLYLGFVGDFCFNDTQGINDPVYTGLGTRYQFLYLEAQDLPPNTG
jgi:hypothetical protein